MRLDAWRNRSLHEMKYPFLVVDALVVKVRRDGAIRPTGVLIVYGINADGIREPLDLLVANSESESSWSEIFKRLKSRGLNGLEIVVSDDHAGLVNAVKQQFQGVIWQRCQTHFMRNILGHSPRYLKQDIANDVKLIFKAENKAVAKQLARETIARYEEKASKAMDCLENGLEDGIAALHLPQRYRQRLRTSNLAERMNEEIRRRERVIRIFPNDEAAMRLIGALLAEKYEEWQASSKYFDMMEFWQWKIACRYLVINSGTSESPEFTRQRDKYACGVLAVLALLNYNPLYGDHNLRSPMTDAFSYALYFACGKTSGSKATRDYRPRSATFLGLQRMSRKTCLFRTK